MFITKRFFEILIYIVGFFFILSWFGFFFLSSELDKEIIILCALAFIISSILIIIFAGILEKKEKYTEKEIQKNIEIALRIRDD